MAGPATDAELGAGPPASLYRKHKRKGNNFGLFIRTRLRAESVPYVLGHRAGDGGEGTVIEVLAGLVVFGSLGFIWAILPDKSPEAVA